jgi:hypothetical protein
MISKAKTVKEYLAEQTPERRKILEAVRKVLRANLDPVFAEGMQYGMIAYHVPHSVYPAGYHCDPKQPLPFAALASQKNYLSLYLCTAYCLPGEEDWFRSEWAKTGKRLDMGKSCIRFKKLDDLPLELVGRAVARISAEQFIEYYESVIRPGMKRGARGGQKATPSPGQKTAAKKARAKQGSARAKSARPAARSKK